MAPLCHTASEQAREAKVRHVSLRFSARAFAG
jgi:hypothetical protein